MRSIVEELVEAKKQHDAAISKAHEHGFHFCTDQPTVQTIDDDAAVLVQLFGEPQARYISPPFTARQVMCNGVPVMWLDECTAEERKQREEDPMLRYPVDIRTSIRRRGGK